jgi:peptidoglycan/LPS O-acetylase OafA/YrhL
MDRALKNMIATAIENKDREYITLIRGISITRVVLVHLGLSWIFIPYSEYIHVFLPLLFFVSGAVSQFSFSRAKSPILYLKKRLLSVAVPYYIIIIISFIVASLIRWELPGFDPYLIYNWATFNAVEVRSSMPFPLGQIWFLHSLVIILILSPALFFLSKRNIAVLPLVMIMSLALGVLQQVTDFGRDFFLFNHNMYQPLSNIGFFAFGAFFYKYRVLFTQQVLCSALLAFLLLSVASGLWFSDSMFMTRHIFAPDIFYISCSYTAILLFLVLQEQITWLVEKTPGASYFFLFMSKHSYSVFLLHSLVLYICHHYFGLDGVMGDPLRAGLKIILVIAITCLISIPVTKLTNKVVLLLQK